MTPTGRRPKGPREDLENHWQQELLDRLHALNTPRRVTYEMVGRELLSAGHGTSQLRTLTRDLSRQFRGDKPIAARVVEVYIELLFGGDLVLRRAELDACLALHALAFSGGRSGDDAEDDGDTKDGAGGAHPGGRAGSAESAESGDHGEAGDDEARDDDAGRPGPPADGKHADATAARIAMLQQQLAEARTRAALASALLVIAHAEITRLRGRNGRFDWFGPKAGATAGDKTPGGSTGVGASAAGKGADLPAGGGATIPLRRPTPLRRVRDLSA